MNLIGTLFSEVDLEQVRGLMERDFPRPGPVTEETLAVTADESERFRGSVRLSSGRVWTDKDYEAYRGRVLATKLP